MKKHVYTSVLVIMVFLSIACLQCQAGQLNPIISVAPASLNLGNIPVGGNSFSTTVTIKNTGTSDLVINSITINGANESEFSQTNNCTTLPVGTSCIASVTFIPTTPFGKKSAIMEISSNDPKKPLLNITSVQNRF